MSRGTAPSLALRHRVRRGSQIQPEDLKSSEVFPCPSSLDYGILYIQKHPLEWEWNPILNTEVSYDTYVLFPQRLKVIHLCLVLGASTIRLGPVIQGQVWSFVPVALWGPWCYGFGSLASSHSHSALLGQLAACRQWRQWEWSTSGPWQPAGQLPPSTAKCTKGMCNHSCVCVCIFKRIRNKISCEKWAAKPSSSIQIL